MIQASHTNKLLNYGYTRKTTSQLPDCLWICKHNSVSLPEAAPAAARKIRKGACRTRRVSDAPGLGRVTGHKAVAAQAGKQASLPPEDSLDLQSVSDPDGDKK